MKLTPAEIRGNVTLWINELQEYYKELVRTRLTNFGMIREDLEDRIFDLSIELIKFREELNK